VNAQAAQGATAPQQYETALHKAQGFFESFPMQILHTVARRRFDILVNNFNQIHEVGGYSGIFRLCIIVVLSTS
jgi:hypothetical protein